MADDATAGAALAQAHQTISEAAKASKRTIAAQRRVLRAQMQELERIERLCAQLGIELRIESTTQAKRRPQ